MSSEPLILHIESATHNCSVAFSRGSELLAAREQIAEGYLHAEKLHLFVKELLEEVNLQPDFVALSDGPGSYTGLRIGSSLAKGLCHGWNIPLIAVPTLEVLLHTLHLDNAPRPFNWYWPMLDAKRMEVYTAGYSYAGELRLPLQAMILSEETPKEIGLCFGDGAEKARGILEALGHQVIDGPHPSARAMIQPALQRWRDQAFANVFLHEPHYLKSFQAGPKRSS